ncbi:tyrosine--tRNA ligase [uncultured Cetobacterium sp.]|uniref:tyrosine--tRNA ligase n=1 Tax=uncultured Cetobacterium sp. TaxID=527638 RepID=UPI00260D8BC7|nr:tyrosine--tRNA ligase [uncultured Cetobacterium sp.]
MSNVFEVLKDRGYVKQMTHEDEMKELLAKEQVTFYIGFDPTADSLHVGHFIAMMFMSHMQKHGHRPIALIGGGTAQIGDPSGRTDMRQMMTDEIIAHNVASIKKQMEKFIDFSDDKALLVNNADWLRNLNYIDFIRDIGSQFSVNRMLAAECFKSRMEEGGLSFLEFNYMLMQGYDFLVLNRKFGCTMQLGGDDQWSNMIAGVDLIRKKDRKPSYAMTCTLLTNSEGKKMGKTAKGALWLDPEKTSPYEFYQYWRNLPDADVAQPLALLTYLPMDEVRRLSALEGAEINEAKKTLAYEVTKIVHGEEEAEKAKQASETLFGNGGVDMSNVPTSEVTNAVLGMGLVDMMVELELLKTKSEGRRLVQQNGLSVNDAKIADFAMLITEDLFIDGAMMIKQGKKKFNRVVIK